MATNVNTRIRGESSDPGVGPGVVVANGQTYDPPTRWLIVSTAGTLTGKMVGDASDVAYVFPVGQHRVALVSCTTIASLVGFVLR